MRYRDICKVRVAEAQGAIRDSDVWGDDYRILKNPTKREMARMAQDYRDFYQELFDNGTIDPEENDVAEDQHVRTLHDLDGRDTYAWGALHNTHDAVAQNLGLSNYQKGHVNYDPKTNTSSFRNYENKRDTWTHNHALP